MSEKFADYKKLIGDSKYKYTKQKETVLKTFIEANRHLSVCELYDSLKKSKIGQATLYRIIKVFKELNIIKEITINGINYYELKIFSGKPLHIHFKCKECGLIEDVDDMDIILDLINCIRKIETRRELDIVDSTITLFGYCKEHKDLTK